MKKIWNQIDPGLKGLIFLLIIFTFATTMGIIIGKKERNKAQQIKKYCAEECDTLTTCGKDYYECAEACYKWRMK